MASLTSRDPDRIPRRRWRTQTRFKTTAPPSTISCWVFTWTRHLTLRPVPAPTALCTETLRPARMMTERLSRWAGPWTPALTTTWARSLQWYVSSCSSAVFFLISVFFSVVFLATFFRTFVLFSLLFLDLLAHLGLLVAPLSPTSPANPPPRRTGPRNHPRPRNPPAVVEHRTSQPRREPLRPRPHRPPSRPRLHFFG